MKIGARFVCLLSLAAGTFYGSLKPEQPLKEFTILIRMMPEQQKFFQSEVIAEFEKKHRCKISIAGFDKDWALQDLLEREAKKKQEGDRSGQSSLCNDPGAGEPEVGQASG